MTKRLFPCTHLCYLDTSGFYDNMSVLVRQYLGAAPCIRPLGRVAMTTGEQVKVEPGQNAEPLTTGAD